MTVTETVETTPANLPNLDCQAPAVDLDVKWRRDFNEEGIPPDVKPDQVIPSDFFEVWTLVSAKVHIRNLSPHEIYVRGINFAAEWVDENGDVQSTRYRYGGLVQGDVGDVPEIPTGFGRLRKAERVDPGDSIAFSREYYARNPWHLRARLREVSDHEDGPYTWLVDTDWWFADEAVRERCQQK
ncbi:hypothetical protein [Gordonia alkanivorans]|uniref:hypothetical protein n=1 Tax=Gordonia alkanivorans TaxID=84096 RepID=UPI00244B72D6|nr:hypothetical protein [Gordonia alkanivorans]MDH3013962.1 hypothetical protein [Gordonia alkanivorans]